jgi:hypothetical protein
MGSVLFNDTSYDFTLSVNILTPDAVESVSSLRDQLTVDISSDRKTAQVSGVGMASANKHLWLLQVSLASPFSADHDVNLMVKYANVGIPQASIHKGSSEQSQLFIV